MNSEQYNLYIEADEEVTTIISRLHVAHHDDVALIVPQHSLLLQSIINLRLLAREAKKQHKNIVIVTQDDEGSTFANKVGISTIPLARWQEESRSRDEDQEIVTTQQPQPQQVESQEGYEVPAQSHEEFIEDESHFILSEDHVEDATGEMVTRSYKEQIHRIKRPVGMDITPQRRTQRSEMERQPLPEPDPDPDLVSKHSQDIQYEMLESTPEIVPEVNEVLENNEYISDDYQISNTQEPIVQEFAKESQLESQQAYSPKQKTFTPKKHKEVKQPVEMIGQDSKSTVMPTPRKIHTLGWIFAFLSAAFVLGFLILPYNVVNVKLGENSLEETLTLTAKTDYSNVDVERRMIPLRKIEKEITRTLKGPATGKADVAAGKGYGTLKIYNTFSEQSQALVATTRFQSPEGIIFRLVDSVTVPGMTKVDDKVEPGVVEVSVVADKSGELGVIDTVDWTIPGFASNKEKFANFYAKNDEPMTDGNTAGKDATVVTKEDIQALKDDSAKGLAQYITAELSELLRETEMLLPEALTYDITRSQSTVTPGTVAEETQYVINARVSAFVFDRQHIEQILSESILAKRSIDPTGVQSDLIYKNIKVDKTQQKLSFNTVVTLTSKIAFDEEKFIDHMKGNNQQEVKDILEKDYPFVSEIALKTYPPFFGSKFSRYAWMTSLEVEQVNEDL